MVDYQAILSGKDVLDDCPTAYAYVSEVCPGLLPDVFAAQSFLLGKEYSEAAKLRILAAMHAVRAEAERRREHRQGSRTDLYALYTELAPQYPLKRETFELLYPATTGIRIDSSARHCGGGIVQAVNNLREKGESDESIAEFLLRLSAANASGRKTAGDIFPPASTVLSAAEDRARKQVYLSALQSISLRPEPIRDALCYLRTDERCNDVDLECQAVMPLMLTQTDVRESSRLIILEPSLMTFRWLVQSLPARYTAVYVFENDTDAGILRNLYENSRRFILSRRELSLTLDGKQARVATVAVLFGNNVATPGEKAELIRTLSESPLPELILYILGPDADLTAKQSPVYQLLQTALPQTVWTYPAKLPDATKPERKLLMRFRLHHPLADFSSRSIAVYQYSQSREDRDRYFLRLRPQTVTVPVEAYTAPAESISFRSLYREFTMDSLARSGGSRKRRELVFADNIVIHYSASPSKTQPELCRIRAYIKTPGERGEIIEDSVRSISLEPERLESWLLSDYPYLIARTAPRISVQAAVAEHASAFLSESSTLRAFIYLRPGLSDNLPAYASELLRLIGSSSLGEYSIGRISEAMLRDFLDTAIPEDAPCTPKQCLRIWSRIFDAACESGLCRENPARQIPDYDTVTDENLSAVRNAFARKFLTEEEFVEVVRLCTDRLRQTDAPYLGVLIKLFTGLESGLIAALSWDDLRSNEDYPDMDQLFCRRQCETLTGTVRKLTSRSLYRIIPPPTFLSGLLHSERERRANRIEAEQDGFGSGRLLPEMTLRGQTRPVLPGDLNRLCREILAGLDIETDPLSYVVDANTTVEIETDFYGKDIFRETYRHYAVKYGGFEAPELSYLLGLSQSSTLYRSYLDFSHSDFQLLLRRKQDELWKGVCHAAEKL